jgi:UPF0755 protein
LRRLFQLALLLVFAAGLWLGWGLLLPTQPKQPQYLLLRPGWTSRRIAAELQARGVIRSRTAFLLYHYLGKRVLLKAGEYKFERRANALTIHSRLAQGDIYRREVVIPEGYNLFEVAAAVEAADLGSHEAFLKAARANLKLIEDIDPKAQSLEGYLFPDTYLFTRTQSMNDIISAMVRRFRQEARAVGLLPGAGDAKRVKLASGPDVHRIVTMASIVEKETAAADERPMVASVYYNRLTKNMLLNADPSVIYASMLAGKYQGTIYQSDLQADSSYNTYKFTGLPPGPIANPGREALKAALHPAVSDYYYFVSDGNGHHRFARTLDEHSRNVAAYRRIMASK